MNAIPHSINKVVETVFFLPFFKIIARLHLSELSKNEHYNGIKTIALFRKEPLGIATMKSISIYKQN